MNILIKDLNKKKFFQTDLNYRIEMELNLVRL